MTVVFLRRPSGQSQFSVQRNACGTSLLRVGQSVICYPGCPIAAQTARGRVAGVTPHLLLQFARSVSGLYQSGAGPEMASMAGTKVRSSSATSAARLSTIWRNLSGPPIGY